MADCPSCSVPGTVGDMGDTPVKTTPKFLSSGSSMQVVRTGGEGTRVLRRTAGIKVHVDCC